MEGVVTFIDSRSNNFPESLEGHQGGIKNSERWRRYLVSITVNQCYPSCGNEDRVISDGEN